MKLSNYVPRLRSRADTPKLILLHFTESLKCDNIDRVYLWMQKEHYCFIY